MQEKKERKHNWILWFFILAILCIGIILVLLFCSKTTTTGEHLEAVTTESIVCQSKTVPYSKLSVGENIKKELLIKMIFQDDALSTISLTYTLWYGNIEAVTAAEARLHADMNINLAKAGYSEGDFSKKFSRLDDRLIMSLYGTNHNIVAESAPYFMIQLNEEHEFELSTSEDYMENYQNQGLTCEKNSQS